MKPSLRAQKSKGPMPAEFFDVPQKDRMAVVDGDSDLGNSVAAVLLDTDCRGYPGTTVGRQRFGNASFSSGE
jgi:hypothetical protein